MENEMETGRRWGLGPKRQFTRPGVRCPSSVASGRTGCPGTRWCVMGLDRSALDSIFWGLGLRA